MRHFQEGRYFEAHEVLEEAWRKAEGEERCFLQGLILLAAALHRGKGGVRNLRKAEAKLSGLPSPTWAWTGGPYCLLEKARRRLGA